MKKHLLILFAAFATLAASAKNFKININGIYYILTSSTTAEVTYRGNSSYEYNEYSGSIAIPATVPHGSKEYNVTSIGGSAFSGCSSLTAITIPESVTSIGSAAFSGCTSLTTITVAEGNAVYDSRGGCNAIIETNSNTLIAGCSTTIIPEGVTSIGNYAFYDCTSLTSINIPESVTSIGTQAFDICSSLTTVTIPEGSQLTSIGSAAFWNCSSLKSITIPESVTSIGSSAFSCCSSLESINIPEGVTSIGDYAFAGCSSLTDITVAEGNAVYDSRGGCNAIIETSSNTLITGCSTTIIPEGVTSIGSEAFWYCSSLTAITIPEGVTSIGDQAFYYCSSLASITCKATTPPTIYKSNVFANVDKSIPVYVPAGSVDAYKSASYWSEFTNIVSMSVPITRITLSQSSATLLVEESLTLTATVAPDNATDKTLTWSSSNPSVATVDNTGKVTAVTPGTATITAMAKDGSGVSAQCEVTVTSTAKVEIDGIWYNLVSKAKQAEVTFKGDSFYSYDEYSGSITIPATVTHNGVTYSVTSIGESAFNSCSSLQSVTISHGVTTIKRGAFAECYELASITIPKGVIEFGGAAFRSCGKLTTITIPESLTSIGDIAFEGCRFAEVHINNLEAWCKIIFGSYDANPLCGTAGITPDLYLNGVLLTQVIIPEGITEIKDYTFANFHNINTVDIHDGVTSIGSSSFYRCENLTTITIPKHMTSIGSSAFRECSSLTTINIPENSQLTSIGEGAFYGCTSLTTVVLPKSVKDIYSEAFAGCPELTDVYCYAKTVPSTSADAFNGSYIEYTTLYVPTSAINSYKGTAPWSGFGKFETTSIAVERITLSQSLATLTEGEDLTLTATVEPNDAEDLSITWSSSNPSVATVDNTGKVTAIAPGTATITVTANDGSGVSAQCELTVNELILGKCATPTISYVDGEVVFTCETEEVTFISETTENIAGNRNDAKFAVIPTYTITAYATKEKYEDSDEVTLTLCWLPCTKEHKEDEGSNEEGEEEDNSITIPSKPVLISARDGVLTLSGLAEGTEVTLYTTDGAMVAQQQSSAGEATFAVDTNQVYLVHIGDKVVKIGM